MGCYDSFSFVTFSLPASEWTVTKTGGPPDDHSTPSHHGPSSSHRRHVTVVALDHALHGGGGLGGCRERSPPDVVFPRGHLDTNTIDIELRVDVVGSSPYFYILWFLFKVLCSVDMPITRCVKQ